MSIKTNNVNSDCIQLSDNLPQTKGTVIDIIDKTSKNVGEVFIYQGQNSQKKVSNFTINYFIDAINLISFDDLESGKKSFVEILSQLGSYFKENLINLKDYLQVFSKHQEAINEILNSLSKENIENDFGMETTNKETLLKTKKEILDFIKNLELIISVKCPIDWYIKFNEYIKSIDLDIIVNVQLINKIYKHCPNENDLEVFMNNIFNLVKSFYENSKIDDNDIKEVSIIYLLLDDNKKNNLEKIINLYKYKLENVGNKENTEENVYLKIKHFYFEDINSMDSKWLNSIQKLIDVGMILNITSYSSNYFSTYNIPEYQKKYNLSFLEKFYDKYKGQLTFNTTDEFLRFLDCYSSPDILLDQEIIEIITKTHGILKIYPSEKVINTLQTKSDNQKKFFYKIIKTIKIWSQDMEDFIDKIDQIEDLEVMEKFILSLMNFDNQKDIYYDDIKNILLYNKNICINFTFLITYQPEYISHLCYSEGIKKDTFIEKNKDILASLTDNGKIIIEKLKDLNFKKLHFGDSRNNLILPEFITGVNEFTLSGADNFINFITSTNLDLNLPFNTNFFNNLTKSGIENIKNLINSYDKTWLDNTNFFNNLNSTGTRVLKTFLLKTTPDSIFTLFSPEWLNSISINLETEIFNCYKNLNIPMIKNIREDDLFWDTLIEKEHYFMLMQSYSLIPKNKITQELEKNIWEEGMIGREMCNYIKNLPESLQNNDFYKKIIGESSVYLGIDANGFDNLPEAIKNNPDFWDKFTMINSLNAFDCLANKASEELRKTILCNKNFWKIHFRLISPAILKNYNLLLKYCSIPENPNGFTDKEQLNHWIYEMDRDSTVLYLLCEESILPENFKKKILSKKSFWKESLINSSPIIFNYYNLLLKYCKTPENPNGFTDKEQVNYFIEGGKKCTHDVLKTLEKENFPIKLKEKIIKNEAFWISSFKNNPKLILEEKLDLYKTYIPLNKKEFWESILKFSNTPNYNHPGFMDKYMVIIKNYNHIPNNIYTDDEKVAHWVYAVHLAKQYNLLSFLDRIPITLQKKVRKSKLFWEELRENNTNQFIENYTKIPACIYPTLRQNKKNWLYCTKKGVYYTINSIDKLPNNKKYLKLKQTLKNDLNFWITGVKSDVTTVLNYIEKNLNEDYITSLLNKKEFWDVIVEKNLMELTLKYYLIPNGIYDKEEQRYHWIKTFRDNIYISLLSYKSIPKHIKNELFLLLFTSLNLLNKENLSLLDSLNLNELNEQNWKEIIAIYSVPNIEWVQIPNEMKESVNNLFPQNDEKSRNFILGKFQELYYKIIKESRLTREETVILEVINKNGLNNMPVIENFVKYLYWLREIILSKDTGTKTRKDILDLTRKIEEKFKKERWGNDDRNIFYVNGRNILEANPVLYTYVNNIFELLNPAHMKYFNDKILPFYNIEIILCENDIKGSGEILKSRQILMGIKKRTNALNQKIAKVIEEKNGSDSFNEIGKILEQEEKNLLDTVKLLFREKLGIIKVPEDITIEQSESIKDYLSYLGNLHGRTEEKKLILGFFLALKLNSKWFEFLKGNINVADEYLDPQKAEIINAYLKRRKELSYIEQLKKEGTFSEKDIEIILQDKTTQNLGNITALDVIISSIPDKVKSNLLDSDIFSSEEKAGRKLIELYKNNPELYNKIPKLLADLFQKKITNSDKDLIQLLKELDIETLDENKIKEIQKLLAIIKGVVALDIRIKEMNIGKTLQLLSNRKIPPSDLIPIFEKIGIPMSTSSGFIPLEQDITFIKNIIKDSLQTGRISIEEKTRLENYTNEIGNIIYIIADNLTVIKNELKNIIDKVKKDPAIGTPEFNLLQRIKDLSDSIPISGNISEKINIITKMTTDFDIIIKNIRACLGCLTPQCNNDTNLSIGEGWRFFITSFVSEKGKSIADELCCLLPSANGPVFVMEKMYGKISADILLSHAKIIAEKAFEKNIPILISDYAITSSGATGKENDFLQALKEIYPNCTLEQTSNFEVTIPETASKGGYFEFGSTGGRIEGGTENNISKTNGWLIRLK